MQSSEQADKCEREIEARTWWVTEIEKQRSGEADTESSMYRLMHTPHQAETGEAQAESRRDLVNQSQAETWSTPCKEDTGWSTDWVRLRLCAVDSIRVGIRQSLVLIEMGMVKFWKSKSKFFEIFEKSKNAANLLKSAQNQKFSENSKKI
jgi:hypothetical protein